MPHRDPTERHLAAQIAAETSWAVTRDKTARTQPARDGLWRKYLTQADPDGTLPEGERVEAAERLMRADMKRLSLAAHKAKRLRREAREAAQRTAPDDIGGSAVG